MSERKVPTPPNLQQNVLKAGCLSGLVFGFVIILILVVAFGIGSWLDSAFSDGGRIYTFVSIFVSVPLTFVVLFFLSRWLSKKLAPTGGEETTGGSKEQENILEDFDRGTN